LSWVLSHTDLATALIEVVIIDDSYLSEDTNTPVNAVVTVKIDPRVLISAVIFLLLGVNGVWTHILSFLHCLLLRMLQELLLNKSHTIRVHHWYDVVYILNQ
jgi:hypothetical protein